MAFIGFSLLASTVYVINDLADAKSDRLHPEKKNRPIAAGRISPTVGWLAAAVLLVLSLAILRLLGDHVLEISLIYLAINLLYSFGYKNVPIVDVLIVSLGFVLRVVIGALAIGVAISHWILLCTFFIALFLAFGKRKNEMTVLKDTDRAHRRSMREYTDGFINQMLALSSGIAVVFYSLYTIDPRTVERFRSDNLVYTTPIVVFCILRYFYLLYNRDQGGDPVRLFFKDKQLFAGLLAWLIVVLLIFYYPVNVSSF